MNTKFVLTTMILTCLVTGDIRNNVFLFNKRHSVLMTDTFSDI